MESAGAAAGSDSPDRSVAAEMSLESAVPAIVRDVATPPSVESADEADEATARSRPVVVSVVRDVA